jgi:preprotein translocase subunit SecA
VRGFLAASIKGLVAEHCQRPAGPTGWDLDGLLTALAALYPVGVRRQELDPERVDGSTLEALLLQDGEHALERREAELGVELLAELERAVLLEALDRNWREHLYEIDCLQEAIGVLTAGQRDPLAEYRRRTLELFRAMEASVRRETVRHVFYASVEIRT